MVTKIGPGVRAEAGEELVDEVAAEGVGIGQELRRGGDHAPEQAFLAAEVPSDEREVDAGVTRDVARGGPVISEHAEPALGCPEQRETCGLCVARSRTSGR